jgi:hypothetical protein
VPNFMTGMQDSPQLNDGLLIVPDPLPVLST